MQHTRYSWQCPLYGELKYIYDWTPRRLKHEWETKKEPTYSTVEPENKLKEFGLGSFVCYFGLQVSRYTQMHLS